MTTREFYNPAGDVASHVRAFKAGLVWSVSGQVYVAFVNANWTDYKITAVSDGGGNFHASVPDDADTAYLCLSGATLEASPAVSYFDLTLVNMISANSTKLETIRTGLGYTGVGSDNAKAAVAGVEGCATAQELADALAGRVDVNIYSAATGSRINIFAGDDYTNTQSISITRQPEDTWWPSNLADVTFSCTPSDRLIELVPLAASITNVSCSITQPTGSNQAFRIPLSSTQTNTLAINSKIQNGYTFIIRANVGAGSPKVLRSGTLNALAPS